MTCPLDALSLGGIEELIAAAQTEVASRQVSPALPAVCTIDPYQTGATDAQKRCHAAATLIMLGKWLHCSLQQDPSACFEGVCDQYADDVDACYAT